MSRSRHTPRRRKINTDVLRQLIEQKDGTAYRAAKNLPISQPSLSKILAGHAQPSSDNLRLFAEYFGVDMEFFYTGTPNAPDNTFAQGLAHGIRQMRRALTALEEEHADLGPTYIRPAPRDADINQRGILPVAPVAMFPEVTRDAKIPASAGAKKKPTGKGKKRA